MSLNVSSSSTTIVPRVSSPTTMKRKRDEDITAKKLIIRMDTHKEDGVYTVLCLLGSYMDPKTLATASCVSTTWSHVFSSESLWEHVLTTTQSSNLASNFAIAKETMERFSYKRFASVIETESKRRRKNQQQQEEKPKISLSDLIFILHVSTESSTTTTTTKPYYKKGKDVKIVSSSDKFQIEFDVSKYEITYGTSNVKFTWQVVYKDWEKLVTLADITRTLDAKYGWFTDELPVKERSCSSKLVGDVKTSYNGEVLEKIGFAIVNANEWGSLMVDDVLRYLQRFFLC